MKTKQTTESLTEAEIVLALQERYPEREYALLPQVRNGTGFSREARTADMIIASLWPSRGLELMGIEIKVSRGDWLREKKDPEKAEAIAKYCDRWWLVIGSEGIVKEDELPLSWGLLVPHGKKLRAVVQAQKLEAKPMDRLFLCSILRKAQEVVIPKAQIDAQVEKAMAAERERMKDSEAWELKRLRQSHEEVMTMVRDFEKASGLQISHSWHDQEKIGEAVKFVLDGGVKKAKAEMERLRESALRIAETVGRELERQVSNAT